MIVTQPATAIQAIIITSNPVAIFIRLMKVYVIKGGEIQGIFFKHKSDDVRSEKFFHSKVKVNLSLRIHF